MYGERYALPSGWGDAINTWVDWLTAAGHSPETIRTRRGMIRSVARQLATTGPDDVSTELLVTLCSRQAWSNDHRRGVRTALILL